MAPDIETQRKLAAAMFPREWALALTATGRRGQQRRASLRKRAANETALAPLRAVGAKCETCRNYVSLPVDRQKRRHCSEESDHDGYSMRAPDSLCVWWKSRAAA